MASCLHGGRGVGTRWIHGWGYGRASAWAAYKFGAAGVTAGRRVGEGKSRVVGLPVEASYWGVRGHLRHGTLHGTEMEALCDVWCCGVLLTWHGSFSYE